MNTLDHLIPLIKRNLTKFDQPGVLFVRPGFCLEKSWPTKKQAIVVVTSATTGKLNLPSSIDGIPVEVRPATNLEQFSHNEPARFSLLADQRVELRGSTLLPEFSPGAGISDDVRAALASARSKKTEISYTPAAVPLAAVSGTDPNDLPCEP